MVVHALLFQSKNSWKIIFPTSPSSPRDASIASSSGSRYIAWEILQGPILEGWWDNYTVVHNFSCNFSINSLKFSGYEIPLPLVVLTYDTTIMVHLDITSYYRLVKTLIIKIMQWRICAASILRMSGLWATLREQYRTFSVKYDMAVGNEVEWPVPIPWGRERYQELLPDVLADSVSAVYPVALMLLEVSP